MPTVSMSVPLLDLSAQYAAIRPEIDAALDAVLSSQRFVLGTNVDALEAEMARYCGAPHAIGVASGSDALLLALMAIGLTAGDEVITTPYTFFATAAAIVRLGGVPIFVDVEPTTLNLSVAQVKSRVTARTKAIIPVHLYGQCADMAPLLTLARDHELMVIEDAAQVIGAEYLLPQAGARADGAADGWVRAGAMGDLGCLSFYPSKALGAYGDAGMVLAHDAPALAAYDQDLWADRLHYDACDLETALADFTALRQANLRLLRRATPDDLRRIGRHAERGDESLSKLVSMYAGHDLVHLRQIARIRQAIGAPPAAG